LVKFSPEFRLADAAAEDGFRRRLSSAWLDQEPTQVSIERERPMNLYVGASGYSYKEWQGAFYPKKLPAKRMLSYYGAHFRTVEINYTFRRLPTKSVLDNWASAVPADFQFVLKAPEPMTHRKRLEDVGDLLSGFLDVASRLRERLGPLLFQLPPTFKKDAPRLHAFLGLLPRERRAAFEFRHPSWFDDEVFALLRAHRAALCIADDILEVPIVATATWGYLRLRRPDYDDAALKMWVNHIRNQNWHDAFVFFKHEDEAKAPRLAKRFLELAD
jgi:uncharacterized protein YecE (DUF72 family)